MTTSNRRRFPLVAAAFVLGGVATLAALYGYWALVQHRFIAVTPDQVYRSAAMPPEELVEVAQQNGIRSVIDLRAGAPEVAAERAALAAAGVQHFHVPSSQVPADTSVDAFLEIIASAENRPVLIHCEHGIGRAPLYSAIYRMEFEDWPNERARSTAYWRSGMGGFQPDDDKGRYILDYQPRHRRGG